MNEGKILDYIQGRLSDADRSVFETQMENDPSFASEVEEYKNMKTAIKSSERNELKSRFQELERNRTRKSWYGKFAIAASVIILFGVGSLFFLKGTSGKELYADNFEIYPNVIAPITRSNEPTRKEYQYFVAYEKGEYSLAIAGFQEQLKVDDNQDIRFYLGMALLNKGEKTKSLRELGKIKKEKTTFYPQALWYSALIYIEKEDFVNAHECLNELSKLNTIYKKKEVNELLEELGD